MSQFEEMIGNNIVSLENLDEIEDKYLLRAPKKGKLLKGPNWTAYNRENLGTIPRKTEKVLIEDSNSKEKLGFSTQTERFSARSFSVKNNLPGPGTYAQYDPFNTSSTSHSVKGYGNGFASVSERFDEAKFYYDQYYPGPGQYKVNDKVSLKTEIDKNIHYKTLYDKIEVKSLKVKQDNPGPGFYNPVPVKAALEKSGPLSSFKSNVNRFKKDKLKTAVPGPGKYNHEVPEEDRKTKTLSYFFKPNSPKKEDILMKYIDDTNKPKVEEGVYVANKETIDPKGSTIYSAGSFGQTKSTFYKTGTKTQGFNINFDYNKNFNMTKKDFFNYVNTNYKNAIKNKSNTRTQSAIPLVNLKSNQLALGRATIEAKREADYIRTYLGKNNKKPLFELSPPRWKDIRHNKYPGPAYYDPSKGPTKIDFFNESMSRWI